MNLLTEHFLKVNNITDINNFEIEDIFAKELIVPERFDLMAKYLYGKAILENINIPFAEELYLAHIGAFSDYTFIEGDGLGKNSKEKYISSFKNILYSIRNKGFDEKESLIPVGSNGEILDGAHRTISAIILNRKVKIIRLLKSVANYDYSFFRNKGLEEKYLDYMAYEYCKLKNNVYIACIWPSAVDKNEEIKKIIQEQGKIFYYKEIELTEQGQINFLAQIYCRHNWIGSYRDNFRGVNSKANECFRNKGNVRIFAFEAENLDKVLEVKLKIRELFKIGNDSIHITDNKEESIEIAQLVFNENSILHLNYGKPTKYKRNYEMLMNYLDRLKINNKNMENFLIVSSMSLSIFGLREANDLDFIAIDSYKEIEDDLIDEHSKELVYHKKSKEELIFSPENYFYYNGLKFVSLIQLKNMKINRNETKDKEDIKLINLILSKKKIISIFFHKTKFYFYKNLRIKKIKLKKLLIDILKKLGLFNKVKHYYKKIKKE